MEVPREPFNAIRDGGATAASRAKMNRLRPFLLSKGLDNTLYGALFVRTGSNRFPRSTIPSGQPADGAAHAD